MKKITYTVDASGEVISPVLHDYELISVTMNSEFIEIAVSDFHRKSRILICCHKPIWIKLESDHLQNVISSLYILRDISEPILSFLPSEIRIVFLNALSGHSPALLLITPATGIELQVVAEDISILTE